ncbi:unnamed protein product [Echinostoma caproni]|uniref:HORMA domain-containing protein n=1 Tax=Echinostoma caproni TaxID=27848 RepID=A0A183BAI1_9TREM|nr:unnamed protein product [Echinostoma caproni]
MLLSPISQILRSFCRVLRESHRCRVIFRKVNGFIYVMQELIYLEGCLNPTRMSAYLNPKPDVATGDKQKQPSQQQQLHSQQPSQRDSVPVTRSQFLANLSYKQVFQLVRTIFTTLGIAMKFEPANAHYFATEVQYSNLTDAVIGLGSFEKSGNDEPKTDNLSSLASTNGDSPAAHDSPFHMLFKNIRLAESMLMTSAEAGKPVTCMPDRLIYRSPSSPSKTRSPERHALLSRRAVECCVLARYLYDMAIDGFDR